MAIGKSLQEALRVDVQNEDQFYLGKKKSLGSGKMVDQ